jgi:PhnB protein
MASIHSYLTFGGNCREAMMFYKSILGGELNFQTVGQSPMSGKMSKKLREYILHSMLKNGSLVLMGSDMVPDDGLKAGNAVSLVLDCSSEKQIREYYSKLSEGGIINHPLEETFWGAIFGSLTDKFGNHWLLNLASQK